MRRMGAVAIALAGLVATVPAAARDPQIGHVLQPGEEPAPGSAVLRLAIGPNARATGCTVERSSGSAETDALACRYFTRRGEWRSQRDAQGHRVGYEIVIEVFREFLDRVADALR